jgi:hypothetical protein
MTVKRALPSVMTAPADPAPAITAADCAAFCSSTGSLVEAQPASAALDIKTAEIDLIAIVLLLSSVGGPPTGITLV